MKKAGGIVALAITLLFTGAFIVSSHAAGTGEQGKTPDGESSGVDYDSGLKEGGGGPDDVDVEGGGDRLERRDLEKSDEEAAGDHRHFTPLRRRKQSVRLRMSFAIGGLGQGVLGPRFTKQGLIQYRYAKGSFEAGFRGGVEGLMFVRKTHCLSLGLFYEQRKFHYSITDISMVRLLAPSVPLWGLYHLNLAKYAFRSMVDANYFAIPLTYRYYFYDEFYAGFALNVAPLILARAGYRVLILDGSIDMRKKLYPVEFGGRVVIGVTMNRVLVEIGVGAGFLDLDRMAGQRRTMTLAGMIGYML